MQKGSSVHASIHAWGGMVIWDRTAGCMSNRVAFYSQTSMEKLCVDSRLPIIIGKGLSTTAIAMARKLGRVIVMFQNADW